MDEDETLGAAGLGEALPDVACEPLAGQIDDTGDVFPIPPDRRDVVQGRVSHHHPATFDTLAMDRDLKRSIVADLDLFASRRDHYRRIGKAWKRSYLLYGPPGTGKSSLVAAMANHLRYDLYDLDLSHVHSNTSLQWLLVGMSNRSILVIEDIDCCCNAMSREADKAPPRTGDGGGDDEIGSGIAFWFANCP